MRIPGAALRTPISIEPALGNLGDGDTYGPPEPVRAAVKTRQVVSNDAPAGEVTTSGQTITSWARARIRPNVLVTGATGPRPPAPGDRLTVNGRTRLIASAEPVQGPGTAVAYVELIAGDD